MRIAPTPTQTPKQQQPASTTSFIQGAATTNNNPYFGGPTQNPTQNPPAQNPKNTSSQNPPVDPADQAFTTKARAAGLTDQQIAVGLMRKKQMEAAGGYNADGTPSTTQDTTQQNYDPFGGRTKQQVLATAFQSGITDASTLANIGKTYDLVTNGGQTDKTAALTQDVTNKMTLGAIMQKYGNNMSPDAILKIYNDHSPWGQASSQSIQQLKQSGYNLTTSSQSAINQDLKDAQTAIDQGADPAAVQKRFIQIHPSSAAAFNNYVQ